MFKFCDISNYSDRVLLLSNFVLLYKQGKLIITRKKNKLENKNFLQIIELNKKVQYTGGINKNQGVSEGTLMWFYSNFYAVPFFFIFINFEYHVRTLEIKLSLRFNFLLRANAYLVNATDGC